VLGFGEGQKGGRGTRMIMENENDKENENESETEAGRVGDLTYFSFFRAAAAGVKAGSSFTAAS